MNKISGFKQFMAGAMIGGALFGFIIKTSLEMEKISTKSLGFNLTLIILFTVGTIFLCFTMKEEYIK